jgi:Zn-finger nucleic acid-binding protein
MSEIAPCPRCGGQLQAYDASQLLFGICLGCAGAWLDNRGCQAMLAGELPEPVRQLLRDAEARAADAPGGYRSAAKAEPSGDAAPCPACAAPLRPYVTDEAKQGVRVELDVCPGHGAWFDRGEAWKLLQAVELKRLAVIVDIETAARERAWDQREATWHAFTAGAAARAIRR